MGPPDELQNRVLDDLFVRLHSSMYRKWDSPEKNQKSLITPIAEAPLPRSKYLFHPISQRIQTSSKSQLKPMHPSKNLHQISRIRAIRPDSL
jgi:hypothetical protein